MAKIIKREKTESLNAKTLKPQTTSAGLNPGLKRRKIISGEEYSASEEAKSIKDIAKVRAGQTISEANAEAEKIIADAQSQAEAIKSAAQEEGLQIGKEEGASVAMEKVANALKRMNEFEENAIPQLKKLAMTIARKIIGKELEFSPEGVVDIIRQALAEKARQRQEIFLRIHPDDIEHIRQNKPRLLEVLSRCNDIAIREDPDVERYGAVIETDAGRIDAQLETQLAVFEKVLLEAG